MGFTCSMADTDVASVIRRRCKIATTCTTPCAWRQKRHRSVIIYARQDWLRYVMRRAPGELIRLIRELHEEEPAMSYSAIARLLSVSRERVRVLWNRYGLSKPTAFNVHTGRLKPRPIAICDGCGIEYEMSRWRRESKKHFHNMECFHAYRRHPDRLLKRAICKMCGNPVKTPGRRAYSPEYCWGCYGSHRTEIWDINKAKKKENYEASATANYHKKHF